jgi:hypothetical protein
MRLSSGTSSPLSGPPSKMPHSTAVRTSQLVKAGVSYWKRYKLPFISARYKWRGKNSQVQSARVYLSPEKFAAMTIAMWRMSILEINWSLSSHRTSVCIVHPCYGLPAHAFVKYSSSPTNAKSGFFMFHSSLTSPAPIQDCLESHDSKVLREFLAALDRNSRMIEERHPTTLQLSLLNIIVFDVVNGPFSTSQFLSDSKDLIEIRLTSTHTADIRPRA